MKKGLSALLSAAMVTSMFASVAFAAETPADPGKYLQGLNVIKGGENGDLMTAANWTRQDVAVLLSRLLGVEATAKATAKSHTYTDVTDSFYDGYLSWAKANKYMEGNSATNFGYNGTITNQEFAAVVLRALGVDTTGENFAKTGELAVKAGIIAAGTDLSAPAKRGDTYGILVKALDVTVGTTGQKLGEVLKLPGYEVTAVSVTEAKAAGVFKVAVKLNKEVDTTKAVLTVKKGSTTVTSTAAWGADKKSAELTLSSRLTEGDYSVTLSGLDAAAISNATATFKAEDEKVTKIDFVNANDTLPYTNFASIKLKAVNQYGEAVSTGTSNFSALVSGQAPASFKKLDDGTFEVIADLVEANNGISQGNGQVPVTVYMNNSNVTVSKIFKVGTVPILSKIEVGELKYDNSKTSLAAADDKVSIGLNFFDQYGNSMVRGQFTGATPEVNPTNVNPVITPYEQKLEVVKTGLNGTLAAADLFDENGNGRIQVKLTGKVDKSGDYVLNIYGGSSSATATFKVGAAAGLGTKIEFDTSSVIVAAGTNDIKVPLVIYDANGTKLSAQEIADDAANNRYTFTVTNGTATVVQTGSDKGKLNLHFNAPASNVVGNKIFISGQVNQSQTNTFVQASVAVTDAKVAETITVTTEPAAKAILGAGDKIVYQLKDQYAKDLSSGAVGITNQSGQTSNFRVKVEVTKEGFGANATPRSVPAWTTAPVVDGNKTTYYFSGAELADFNAGFDYTTTDGQVGKATVRAVIEKSVNGGTYNEYSSAVSRTMEAVKSDIKLTYSLGTIGDTFAAKDKLGATAFGFDLAPGSATNYFDKKLSVTAKDESGNKVKLPSNYIRDISASDPNVLAYAKSGANDAYIVGNKAGTATVSAVVYTNKGELINLTQDVTVKADAITVDSITAGKSSKAHVAGTQYAYDYFTKDDDNKLTVKDQYGVSYKNEEIYGAFNALGILYTVKVTSGTGLVTMDAKTGQITNVDATVNEYVITASAPNGKSVQVVVSR